MDLFPSYKVLTKLFLSAPFDLLIVTLRYLLLQIFSHLFSRGQNTRFKAKSYQKDHICRPKIIWSNDRASFVESKLANGGSQTPRGCSIK